MPKELLYFVSGLWCQTCAGTVEAMTSRCRGVSSSRLNFASKILRVQLEPDAHLEDVNIAIEERARCSGFGLKRLSSGWVHNFKTELKNEMERRVQPLQTAVVLFLSMWASMAAFTSYLGGLSSSQKMAASLLTTAFGLPALILGVHPFARAGIRAFRSGRTLTLDLFITLGAVSASVVSLVNLEQHSPTTFVDSAAMVLSLLLLTKHLEAALSYRLSSRILEAVKPLQPSIRVLRSQTWRDCPVSQVRKGERVCVDSGETISLDGRLTSPQGKIDRHLLTGEAGEHTLFEGDELLAGMVSKSRLEFTVLKPLGSRMVDHWAESALTAERNTHTFSEFLGRVERRLVQLAICGAVTIALARLAATGSVGQAIIGFFVGVLIFCPCLFATILPLAKQLATLWLWKRGVLLHRAEALFDLSTIERIYLDKTGTLEGVETSFQSVIDDTEKVRQTHTLLSALRHFCEHPILRGLPDSPAGVSIKPQDLLEVAGSGVRASFPNLGTISVGRPLFISMELGLSESQLPATDHLPLVAVNGTVTGVIVSKSRTDSTGHQFLDQLSQIAANSVRIEILSGDPDPKAKSRLLGTHLKRIHYHGNLSPEEKANRIKNPSLFVGDGLNDTLALGRAQVSCRIGARAKDFIPVDLHLQGGNLLALLTVLQYSRRFVEVLRQTAALALLYNLSAITLAASGLFTPLGAVVAMVLSFLILMGSVSRLFGAPR